MEGVGGEVAIPGAAAVEALRECRIERRDKGDVVDVFNCFANANGLVVLDMKSRR